MSSRPRATEYTGPRTLVLDVSHWQGEIDWTAVANDASEPEAVMVRLGDGKDRDRRAVENLHGAQAAGLLVGAYRYLRAEHPVGLQIDLDRAILAESGVTLDLPLCADLEGGPDPDGAGPRKARGAWQDVRRGVEVDTDDVLDHTRAYLAAATELTGLTAWLYTGAAWRDHVRTPPRWAVDVPLWLAVGARGRIPAPWTECLLHQYSAKGRVRGITGNVDLNHYHGSVADLRAARSSSAGEVSRTPLVPAADALDRAAAVLDLAEGATPAERAVLLVAARRLGALRRC